MNCLTEATGPGPAGQRHRRWRRTPRAARRCSQEAGRTDRGPARAYYERRRRLRVLPRAIATKASAFENAMALDVAMGGSTNTVLHLLAAAQEAEVRLHRGRHRGHPAGRVPCLCKVAPTTPATTRWKTCTAPAVSPRILGELERGGRSARDRAHRCTRASMAWTLAARVGHPRRHGHRRRPLELFHAAPGVRCGRPRSRNPSRRWGQPGHRRRRTAASATWRTPTPPTAAWRCCAGTWPWTAASSRPPASTRASGSSPARPWCCESQEDAVDAILQQAGAARRRRGDPLRGPRGRPGDAGDALPDSSYP